MSLHSFICKGCGLRLRLGHPHTHAHLGQHRALAIVQFKTGVDVSVVSHWVEFSAMRITTAASRLLLPTG